MPWYVYLALKQLFPTGRFPFFTVISVVGVTLGVAVLVIVTSIMGGFQYEIGRMITATEGEITVRGTTELIEDLPKALDTVRRVPGVAAATPAVKGPVLMQNQLVPAFPFFRGLDLDSVNAVTDLGRFVTPGGALDKLDDDSVVLSQELAVNLGAKLGDEVEVLTPLVLERAKVGETILPKKFRVIGYFYIGHHHLDSSLAFGTLRAAQELYGLKSHVHGIHVKLKPDADAATVINAINAVLPQNQRAFFWMESWQDFLLVLNLEKTINFFLLLFIVIIAAFSVMSSLLIAVVRKTREIGLLGALGANARQVALCFCTQAFIIGVVGTIVGVAVGYGVLAIRQDIIDTLTSLLKRQGLLQQFYEFVELPSHPSRTDITMTIVSAIVLSTLAGLLPAWRAAKLKPVEALRSQ
jgi:lipoprotein-releasing system permease protein